MEQVRQESVDGTGQSPEDTCPAKVGHAFWEESPSYRNFEMSAFRDTLDGIHSSTPGHFTPLSSCSGALNLSTRRLGTSDAQVDLIPSLTMRENLCYPIGIIKNEAV